MFPSVLDKYVYLLTWRKEVADRFCKWTLVQFRFHHAFLNHFLSPQDMTLFRRKELFVLLVAVTGLFRTNYCDRKIVSAIGGHQGKYTESLLVICVWMVRTKDVSWIQVTLPFCTYKFKFIIISQGRYSMPCVNMNLFWSLKYNIAHFVHAKTSRVIKHKCRSLLEGGVKQALLSLCKQLRSFLEKKSGMGLFWGKHEYVISSF